jgi:hypothetical protein
MPDISEKCAIFTKIEKNCLKLYWNTNYTNRANWHKLFSANYP